MAFLRDVASTFFGKASFKLIELGNQGEVKADSVVFQADAVISESYNLSANVTTFPVESDSDISIGSRVNNFTINMQGISSDASMSYFNLIEDIQSSSLGRLFSTSTKSQAVWEQLSKWVDNGTPLQLNCKFAREGFRDKSKLQNLQARTTTQGGAIIPFVIQSLGVNRDKDTGASISYNIGLRRIRLVQIGEADFVETAIGTSDRGNRQLTSNSKSDAVDGQSTATRTQESICGGAGQSATFRGITTVCQ